MQSEATLPARTWKTRMYGLWFAVVKTDDGRTFEGSGTSEGDAVYRARRKAREAQEQAQETAR